MDPYRRIILIIIAFGLLMPSATLAGREQEEPLPPGRPVIWKNRGTVAALDLYYGPGGRANAPRGPFKFVKETRSGSRTQFIVTDTRGVSWRAKLGKEAQAETVATRLLWAAGYFADETYYIHRLRIADIENRLTDPPADYVTGDIVNGARFERDLRGVRFVEWDWFDNPFIGTREFDGLRVMMALINNWDLKKSNNRIAYDRKSRELRYLVHDIGATFGKTGAFGARSKNDLEDYAESKFIEEIQGDRVDLVLKSRPPFYLAINPVYYADRTEMEQVGEDIPRAHARWIGQLLSRLSDKQLRDAFRAAGYSAAETRIFARTVRTRINQLVRL